MDKILFYGLLLIPGFITLKVAEHFGLNSNKRSNLDEILRYILVGSISVLLTVMVAKCLRFIPADIDFDTFIKWCNYPSFVANYVALSVVVSVTVGCAWTYATKQLMRNANKINRKLGLNPSFSEPLPYHRWADGKDHFLIIRKGGEVLGAGFLYAMQNNRLDHLEIELTEYPEYKQELKACEAGNDSPLANVITTYIDTETGLVICETEYPAHWVQAVDSAV